MAKRARKSEAANRWMIGLIVLLVVLLMWWLSARRAETPGLPASQPGARALSEAPNTAAGAHDEITDDEKQGLERILRERGTASPIR